MLWRLVPLGAKPLHFEGGAGAAGGPPATGGGSATPPQPQGQGDGGAPATGSSTAAQAKPASEDLGATGKRLIKDAQKAAKAAERERDELKARLDALESGTSTEHQQAVDKSARDARNERDAHWAGHVRAAHVAGALRAEGITNDKTLALLMAAPEVRDLEVDPEDGTVDGVADAMAKLREGYPELFAKAPTPTPPPNGGQPQGQWDGGQGGQAAGKKPATMEQAVMEHYQQKQR